MLCLAELHPPFISQTLRDGTPQVSLSDLLIRNKSPKYFIRHAYSPSSPSAPRLHYRISRPIYLQRWVHPVAGLVELLRYKPEGRGIDSRRWPSGSRVDSASNRNEHQEYFLGDKGGRCLGLTNLPLHVSIVLQSGSLSLPETYGFLQTCNGIALSLFL